MKLPDLFKVKKTRWVDADGKRMKASTPGATKEVTTSKDWYAELPVIESAKDRIVRRRHGKKKSKGKRVRLCQNKRAAKVMLRNLIEAAERKAAGVADYSSETQQPLGELVDRYHEHLLAKGNTKEYAGLTIRRIETVFGACQFLRIADLDSETAATWLYRQRQEKVVEAYRVSGAANSYQEIADEFGVGVGTVTAWKKKGAPIQPRGETYLTEVSDWYNASQSKSMGAATSNHHVTALRGFGKWLWRNARVVERSPFELLDKIDAKSDVRKSRRALKAERFSLFVDAAKNSPKMYKGLSGQDRAMLYLLAAYTGLRASEIASTTRRSYKLDSNPAMVTVRGAYTKNSDLARIPLDSSFADQLANYFNSIEAEDGPIWPGNWNKAAAEMIRRDLKLASIPYTDENGDDYDFHALRHQFITDLARADVSLNVAKELARHSKVDLTANIYTHLSFDDKSAAIEKLGQIREDRSPFGIGSAEEPNSDFGTVHGTVENAKLANLSDILDEAVDPPENEKSPQNVELSGLFEGSPGRARTYDKRINSPLLYQLSYRGICFKTLI